LELGREKPSFTSGRQAFADIMKKEGYRGLFRGILP
jgi:hypothetical protein